MERPTSPTRSTMTELEDDLVTNGGGTAGRPSPVEIREDAPATGPGPVALRLSVVIPAIDEAERIPRVLEDLAALALPHEVVVADGGSSDGTRKAAARAGARVVTAPRGRARQLRAGVEASRAPWLLLVHADCRMPPDAARALEAWLAHARPTDSAHFRFALAGRGAFWRFIEVGQRLRERLSGLVYGDQGLVLSRETWDAVDGVPDVPIMEDVALVDRVRRRGRLHRLPAALPTSPRRYEAHGRWREWLRNALLVALYRLGVAPATLARLRPGRPARPGDAGSADGAPDAPPGAVIVFARAPRPGRVKTRLAAETGPEAAARLYRAMGRTLVDRLRPGPWELAVAFDPPDALEEVRAWLGEGPRWVVQEGPDLGARMERALADALAGADRACIVGTDVPDLDRSHVEDALTALTRHDLVLGPCEDGGYYLVGLRAGSTATERRALFRDVPWSTPDVLRVTLERARAAGLDAFLLPTLRDVDTLADVPAGLRASL